MTQVEHEYLTPKEYADLLRIGIETMYKLLQRGKIPDAQRVGGQWRIRHPRIKPLPSQ